MRGLDVAQWNLVGALGAVAACSGSRWLDLDACREDSDCLESQRCVEGRCADTYDDDDDYDQSDNYECSSHSSCDEPASTEGRGRRANVSGDGAGLDGAVASPSLRQAPSESIKRS